MRQTSIRFLSGLAVVAALAGAGCGDVMVQSRSSGRLYPGMNLDQVSARLEPATFDKVKIIRRAAPYEPYPTVTSADRAASNVQIKALREGLVRGFTTRLFPQAQSNGLRIIAAGPGVKTLAIVPVGAETSCMQSGCGSLLELMVQLKGDDGKVLWTYYGNYRTEAGQATDAHFDQLVKLLFEAMRRDAVLP